MARKLSVPKNFQVGDIVLVERSGKDMRRSPKWKGAWTLGMQEAVGKCFTVMRENNGNGVGLAFKGAIWGFPEKSLRLIKRGDKTYYRTGDKVLIARQAEGTKPNWNQKMPLNIGKAFVVEDESGQGGYAPSIKLRDDTGDVWWYGSDCTELYTGQVPDKQPQPQQTMTITEPLQAWERF